MAIKEQLEGIWQFLEGKKTYIASAVLAGLSAATAMGYTVPVWVLILLAAVGITTSRMGTSDVDNYYFEEAKKLRTELDKIKTMLADKR